MDSLADIPGTLGGFGALGLLTWWGLRVMRQTTEDKTADREQYVAVIAARDREIDALRKQLEEERRARWAAEDSAAAYRRELQERGGMS